MRDLCEITWQDTEKEEPVTVKEQYWLLHFGLKYQLIEMAGGNTMAVSYTTCICQSVKTGQLEMFDPSQIRVIGTEIKK
jgi:hypothetical protein